MKEHNNNSNNNNDNNNNDNNDNNNNDNNSFLFSGLDISLKGNAFG
jgi:hypothetical protein